MVENGQQAVEYLSVLPDDKMPCLAIFDMNMPVMNGLQTLNALNADKRCSKIPKVIFSTSDSIEYKTKSMNYGASDYVVKPFSLKEFIICLDRMIDYCRSKINKI